MIAKRIVRERGASNFRRLGRYILDGAAEEEQAVMARMADYILGAEKSRAANVRFSNCVSTDAELALKEILATQAMNKRAKGDRTYHLVISFPPGERPTLSQLEDIERVLCERIGLGGHQRLSATHLDTGHLHLHVAINKIHPESFRCVEPYYDKRRLMQACVELEAKHGLIRTAHGEVSTVREATRTARQTMLALLQSNILPKLLIDRSSDVGRAASRSSRPWSRTETARSRSCLSKHRRHGESESILGRKRALSQSADRQAWSLQGLRLRGWSGEQDPDKRVCLPLPALQR